jgi:stress response protein SCP2
MIAMESKLEKEVRFLKIYAVVATLICGVFLSSAFTFQNRKQKFEEIDVERINVVEKDGKLKMVISNRERQTPVIVDGKTFAQEGGRSAGMIFFNEKGDEVGGLIFRGNTGEGQQSSFTFDKFRGDQTIAFQHQESSDGEYRAHLAFNDVNLPTAELVAKLDAIKQLPNEAARNAAVREMRERGEFMVNRLALGKGRDKSAYMNLSDAKGRTRIRIVVTAEGTPKIDFLDEAGKVTHTLPEVNRAGKK